MNCLLSNGNDKSKMVMIKVNSSTLFVTIAINAPCEINIACELLF